MNQHDIKPDLFIVGGPKCATTALVKYLEEHPDVCMAFPKEPHYFLSDYPEYRQARTIEQYLDMFKFDPEKPPKVIGEGSTWYLFSETAIKNILQYNPAAKIIIMLRNPLQVVPSLYWQFLYGHEEDAKTFEEAWKLQGLRHEGQKVPKHILEPQRLQYAKVGAFGTQLARARDIVPKDQLKVIIFDDFIADTKSIFDDVLTFLDLENINKTNFQRTNARKTHRSKLLSKLIRPSKPINFIVRTIKKMLGIKSIGLSKKIKEINLKRVKGGDDLSKELIQDMHKAFDPEIEKLEQLLERDLSHWKQYKL
ncbi:MAG: sulfotransferase [Gammaproteobacteria bacterium]|nr:sulfotransferase [Gammaproteobacteria bacterium]MDH5729033.1 sulfotransferase [Gammaproteobacteria bacterium]